MRIVSVASALPQHYYSQAEITDALKAQWAGELSNPQVLDRLYPRAGVQGRALSLPLEDYKRGYTWGERNTTWLQVAQYLGEAAIGKALAAAGVSKDQLGAFFFVSVTGIASPSVDARLINRMGLSANIKRVPIFGLGCVGGAAGIARAADYVKAHPDEAAVLLSVELCSLTWQRADVSAANVISSMLFGDGAAAVVVCGRNMSHSGPEILATRSIFYPNSEELMGWDISENGFRIVLSPDVPKIILEHLGKDVDEFLGAQGLCRCDIKTWIMHTGGPKVLEATESALKLPKGALDVSWNCLRKAGNLSSASVLLVLENFMTSKRPKSGSYGLLAAMGPGFCSELVLIRW
ncbi:MAG TPA: 3-oxoacyl-[acyl-carrier-protein] synthase III C-terminal domain-containing protein [Terriglobales bacterium]|jgi:alkylresorcinol/alkylpyrone synthase|nr:3-oxoacyl-[acyl-carrier-protein] synthase III C-terminal domain-containing protein [Terriglobales bacterium]